MEQRYAKPVWMWFWAGMAGALFWVGVITAAMRVMIAGFTPEAWFLMSIAFYMGMLWSPILRIALHLEGRTKS